MTFFSVALKPLARFQKSFDVGGGVVLILTGLYMLNAYFLSSRKWQLEMEPSLENDVFSALSRACRERDWEVAEFLFQALEAICNRQGDGERLQQAFGELAEHLGKPARQ